MKGSLCIDDLICYTVFFAHQCNASTTIVAAMKQIVTSHLQSTKENGKENLYSKLVKSCCMIKKLKYNGSNKDVGSGSVNRFQCSNNQVYDDVHLQGIITSLRHKFQEYSDRMSNTSNSKQKYLLFSSLIEEIDRDNELFPGIGKFRASHLVQLSSLIGLLPLEFYTYVPLHATGGTWEFLKNTMNIGSIININGSTCRDELIEWTVTEMKKLQSFFTKEYTPNMNENLHCILGRKLHKKDVMYLLPWIDKAKRQLTCPSIQYVFRVNSHNSNKLYLECFDGTSIRTIIGDGGLLKRKNDKFELDWNYY